jgi:hypothetical protein
MSYEDVEAMHVDIGPDNDHDSSRAATFWRETDRYHDLAQQFEENIERHGARGYYECELAWGGHCPYCATNVTYYEYRGPNV